MFGFIEERLALVLGIPFEPFVLNGGGVAAMITKNYYIRVLGALQRVWELAGDSDRLMPLDKEADIVGMRVIIHKYYYNDDILNSLTNGSVKETTTYEAIQEAGVGTQRFDVANFEREIRTAYAEEPMPEEPEPMVRVIRPEDMAQPTGGIGPAPERRAAEERLRGTVRGLAETMAEEVMENVEDEGGRRTVKRHKTTLAEALDKVSETVDERLQQLHTIGFRFESKNDSKFKVCKLRAAPEVFDDSFLFDFANQVKCHLIIGDDRRWLMEAKKALSSKSIVNQSFLFIATNGAQSGYTDITNTISEIKSTAFGTEIHNLAIIKGNDVNKEIQAIKDGSMSSDAKKEAIDKIFAEQRNSPYAKYDKIYKDTATNVVFALQERNIIILMFNAYDNKKFAKTAMSEIARRFDGLVPYSELLKIDSNYQAILEKGNCDEYIKFVMDSSSSVIRQLKKAYEDAKAAYEDYLTKAMESGKMCSKYMEQIESFNESEQQTKMRKKAFDEYTAVKSIPKVKTVFIKDETVHVYTDDLYARDDRSKKMHDIGTFHITIGMHSNSYNTDNTVLIKNTKHQIVAFSGQNMQAPHVFQDGHICHGTLAIGMTNAYKKRDLYQLVLQLILFLQQANTDDAAGKYVNCWPEISEEMIRLQEQKATEKEPEKAEFINKPEDQHFDEVLAGAIPV
jgi:hypothetical protein